MEAFLVLCFVFLCVFAFSGGAAATARAVVWYVQTDGSDSNGGSSWDDAFATIQRAIDSATDRDEIWVQKGTYFLNSQINVDKTVAIYGGFDGTETEKTQRNWMTNVTKVDGQDTAYHCFFVTADAFIDGFTITGGNARLALTNKGGGGINVRDCSPTISNCNITVNSAALGGGICVKASSATIINCDISKNQARRGGGIYGTVSFFIITNCTLFDNYASNKGGGMYHWDSSPIITNCTFSKNRAADYGGGIYSIDSFLTISNCILWGDLLTIGDELKNGPEISSKGSTYDITFCNIKWGFYYADEDCISQDPLFVDEENGDLHLMYGSPCIGAGANDAPRLSEKDKDGKPRITDGTVDMGAYAFGGKACEADFVSEKSK